MDFDFSFDAAPTIVQEYEHSRGGGGQVDNMGGDGLHIVSGRCMSAASDVLANISPARSIPSIMR